jgi:hypothetical protein
VRPSNTTRSSCGPHLLSWGRLLISRGVKAFVSNAYRVGAQTMTRKVRVFISARIVSAGTPGSQER